MFRIIISVIISIVSSNIFADKDVDMLIAFELKVIEKYLNTNNNNTELKESQLENDLSSRISDFGSLIIEHKATTKQQAKNNKMKALIAFELKVIEKYLNANDNNTELKESQLENDLSSRISDFGSLIIEHKATTKQQAKNNKMKALIAFELKAIEKYLNANDNNTELKESQLENDLSSRISDFGSLIIEHKATTNGKTKNINNF